MNIKIFPTFLYYIVTTLDHSISFHVLICLLHLQHNLFQQATPQVPPWPTAFKYQNAPKQSDGTSATNSVKSSSFGLPSESMWKGCPTHATKCITHFGLHKAPKRAFQYHIPLSLQFFGDFGSFWGDNTGHKGCHGRLRCSRIMMLSMTTWNAFLKSSSCCQVTNHSISSKFGISKSQMAHHSHSEHHCYKGIAHAHSIKNISNMIQ